MKAPRIGLLPLYVELYDQVLPELRATVEPLTDQVCEAFASRKVDVIRAATCCVREQVEAALKQFDAQQVDMIVTLHLAYSPSLETVEALAATSQALLLLDTTLDSAFSRDVDPMRLLYNHGIHGVQDLAAMLRRHKKDYEVVAGHLSDSSVMDRVVDFARAAHAASLLKGMKTLGIGGALKGMGDFRVAPNVLADQLGITVDNIQPSDLVACAAAVTDEAIEDERLKDLQRYQGDIDPEVHRRSLRVGLGLRTYLEQGEYEAFSMNFEAFRDADGPVNAVPFLECCKAMARGVGYSGEGDVLTASLSAALGRAYGKTSFVEMFCPDWDGNSIFLSHMGEFNPELSAEKPLLYEKEYPFSPAQNPAALGMAPEPGKATHINLSPGPDDSFRLIISLVDVLEDGTHPDLPKWVRAWIRPPLPVAEFLEKFSRLGGTHHSVLVMGDHCESLGLFGRLAGMEVCVL
tara:strand:- start:3237 stop:4625 length:1389 start_codon:yes stop_codon:yes gene_type:complete